MEEGSEGSDGPLNVSFDATEPIADWVGDDDDAEDGKSAEAKEGDERERTNEPRALPVPGVPFDVLVFSNRCDEGVPVPAADGQPPSEQKSAEDDNEASTCLGDQNSDFAASPFSRTVPATSAHVQVAQQASNAKSHIEGALQQLRIISRMRSYSLTSQTSHRSPKAAPRRGSFGTPRDERSLLPQSSNASPNDDYRHAAVRIPSSASSILVPPDPLVLPHASAGALSLRAAAAANDRKAHSARPVRSERSTDSLAFRALASSNALLPEQPDTYRAHPAGIVTPRGSYMLDVTKLFYDRCFTQGNSSNKYLGLKDLKYWHARDCFGVTTHTTFNSLARPLGLIAARGELRKKLVAIVDSNGFSRLVLLAIMANAVQLAFDVPSNEDNPGVQRFLEIAEYVFLAIFTVEAMLKILAMGFCAHVDSYLVEGKREGHRVVKRLNWWNVVDFIIVILAWVGLHPSVTNVSVVRSLRLLRPLKALHSVEGLQIILRALLTSMGPLWNVIVLLFFFMTMFAITGVLLWEGAWHRRCYLDLEEVVQYGNETDLETALNASAIFWRGPGDPPVESPFPNASRPLVGWAFADWALANVTSACTTSRFGTHCNARDTGTTVGQTCEVRSWRRDQYITFDNTLSALLTVFKVISTDDWPDDMELAFDSVGQWAFIYFLAVTLFGSFFTINLVLAILVGDFSSISHEIREEKNREKTNEGLQVYKFKVSVATIHFGFMRLAIAVYSAGLRKPSPEVTDEGVERIMRVFEAIKESQERSREATAGKGGIRRYAVTPSLRSPGLLPRRQSTFGEDSPSSDDGDESTSINDVAEDSNGNAKSCTASTFADGTEPSRKASVDVVNEYTTHGAPCATYELPHTIQFTAHETSYTTHDALPYTSQYTTHETPYDTRDALRATYGLSYTTHEAPCATYKRPSPTHDALPYNPRCTAHEAPCSTARYLPRDASAMRTHRALFLLLQRDPDLRGPFDAAVRRVSRKKLHKPPPRGRGAAEPPAVVAQYQTHETAADLDMHLRAMDSNDNMGDSATDAAPKETMDGFLRSGTSRCPDALTPLAASGRRDKTFDCGGEMESPSMPGDSARPRPSPKTHSSGDGSGADDDVAPCPVDTRRRLSEEAPRGAPDDPASGLDSSRYAHMVNLQKSVRIDEEDDLTEGSQSLSSGSRAGEAGDARESADDDDEDEDDDAANHLRVRIGEFSSAATTAASSSNEGSTNWLERHNKTVKQLVVWKWFNRFVVFIIAVNILAMCLDHYGISREFENAIEAVSFVCNIIFILEMLLKWAGLSIKGYFKDKWNVFDFLLVVVSLPEMFIAVASSEQGGSGITALRALRAFRVTRLLRRYQSLQQVVTIIMRSVGSAVYLCLIMVLFIFVFSVLGVQLFARSFPQSERSNFSSLWHAMVTVFIVITGEKWSHVMKVAMDVTNPAAALYFIALFSLGNYIFMNLFIAILIDNFANMHRLEHEERKAREAAKKQRRDYKKRKKKAKARYLSELARKEMMLWDSHGLDAADTHRGGDFDASMRSSGSLGDHQHAHAATTTGPWDGRPRMAEKEWGLAATMAARLPARERAKSAGAPPPLPDGVPKINLRRFEQLQRGAARFGSLHSHRSTSSYPTAHRLDSVASLGNPTARRSPVAQQRKADLHELSMSASASGFPLLAAAARERRSLGAPPKPGDTFYICRDSLQGTARGAGERHPYAGAEARQLGRSGILKTANSPPQLARTMGTSRMSIATGVSGRRYTSICDLSFADFDSTGMARGAAGTSAPITVYRGKSLGIFSFEHPLRQASIRVVTHRFFDWFILFVITCNIVILGLEGPWTKDAPREFRDFLDVSDVVFVVLFTVEAAMKIVAFAFIGDARPPCATTLRRRLATGSSGEDGDPQPEASDELSAGGEGKARRLASGAGLGRRSLSGGGGGVLGSTPTELPRAADSSVFSSAPLQRNSTAASRRPETEITTGSPRPSLTRCIGGGGGACRSSPDDDAGIDAAFGANDPSGSSESDAKTGKPPPASGANLVHNNNSNNNNNGNGCPRGRMQVPPLIRPLARHGGDAGVLSPRSILKNSTSAGAHAAVDDRGVAAGDVVSPRRAVTVDDNGVLVSPRAVREGASFCPAALRGAAKNGKGGGRCEAGDDSSNYNNGGGGGGGNSHGNNGGSGNVCSNSNNGGNISARGNGCGNDNNDNSNANSNANSSSHNINNVNGNNGNSFADNSNPAFTYPSSCTAQNPLSASSGPQGDGWPKGAGPAVPANGNNNSNNDANDKSNSNNNNNNHNNNNNNTAANDGSSVPYGGDVRHYGRGERRLTGELDGEPIPLDVDEAGRSAGGCNRSNSVATGGSGPRGPGDAGGAKLGNPTTPTSYNTSGFTHPTTAAAANQQAGFEAGQLPGDNYNGGARIVDSPPKAAQGSPVLVSVRGGGGDSSPRTIVMTQSFATDDSPSFTMRRQSSGQDSVDSNGGRSTAWGGGRHGPQSEHDSIETALEEVRPYLSSPWNRVDFFVCLTAILGIFIPFFALFRSLRSLRLIIRNQNIKVVVRALFHALPAIGNVLAITSFVFVVFSILGVQLFKGKAFYCTDAAVEFKADCHGAYFVPICSSANASASCPEFYCHWEPLFGRCVTNEGAADMWGDPVRPEDSRPRRWLNSRWNFDNVGESLLTLFQVSFAEGWSDILWLGVDAESDTVSVTYEQNRNPFNALFFICFMVVGNFFALNLFIGLLIDRFTLLRKQLEGSAFLTESQQEWVKSQKSLSRMTLEPRPQCPERGIRRYIFKIVAHPQFDQLIMLLICVNVVIISLRHYGQPESLVRFENISNFAFVGIFTVEQLMKIYGFGKLYFKDSWNRFDLFLVALSLGGLAIGTTSFQIFRFMRVARILRLIKKASGLSILFGTLYYSLPSLMNIGMLLLCAYYNYGILGVQMFGEVRRSDFLDKWINFENLGKALISLYTISTTEKWTDVMEGATMDQEGCEEAGDCGADEVGSAIYFCSFMVIGSLITLNLFITVVLENFSDQQTYDYAHAALNDFKEAWVAKDPKARGWLHFIDFLYIIKQLPPPIGLENPDSIAQMIRHLRFLSIPINREGRLRYSDALSSISKKLFDIREEDMALLKKFTPSRQHDAFTVYHLYAALRIQERWKRYVRRRKKWFGENGLVAAAFVGALAIAALSGTAPRRKKPRRGSVSVKSLERPTTSPLPAKAGALGLPVFSPVQGFDADGFVPPDVPGQGMSKQLLTVPSPMDDDGDRHFDSSRNAPFANEGGSPFGFADCEVEFKSNSFDPSRFPSNSRIVTEPLSRSHSPTATSTDKSEPASTSMHPETVVSLSKYFEDTETAPPELVPDDDESETPSLLPLSMEPSASLVAEELRSQPSDSSPRSPLSFG
ncbi:Sodium channel protein 60E [Diplonema papillatum]|nr:Sodium channel protein 60E [Diplonema papillatum]KAJ9451265.1 Sodium channel protein 60E [Diplonema papillatum]